MKIGVNDLCRILFKKTKFWFFLQILTTIYIGITPLLVMTLTKNIINTLQGIFNNDIARINTLANFIFLYLLIIFIDYSLTTISNFWDSKVSAVINFDLQNLLIKKASSSPYYFFETPEFQNHLNRVSINLDSVFMTPVKSLLGIIQKIISFITLFVFIFYYSKVAGVSLLLFVPIIFINIKMGMEKYNNNINDTPKVREMNYLNDLLIDRNAALEIRIFDISNYLHDKWKSLYWHTNLKILKINKNITKKNLFLSLAMIICISILIIDLSRSVIMGLISLGVFVSLFQSVNTIQATVLSISMEIAGVFTEVLYLRDYIDFLNYEDKEVLVNKDTTNKIDLQGNRTDSFITLDNIGYSYPKSNMNVLKNISFSIEKGEKIAIVGENGSGKTTLVKCILNILEPIEGSIKIKNCDLSMTSKKSFLEKFTVIPQNFIKYNLSIKDNIILNKKFCEKQFWKAVRFAKLENLINKLPEKENTILGKSYQMGEDLSGGQWQSIAIARAAYRDGEILIMDEPTSALDFKAEQKFYSEISEISKNKTILFISHRTSFTKMADKIIVLKHGSIEEIGTHEDLIKKNGLYQEMYTSQVKMVT